ncbi:MAG TPA: maleylacetate reductase [Ilumatobacter sp.]
MTPDFVSESLPGRVVFGSGSRHRLDDEIDRLGSRRVVVIAAEEESAIADPIIASLGDRVVGRFAEVVQHVPDAVSERCTALVVERRADAIVTIGGGSATGFGKVVRLSCDVASVAVPTTYAGSEMTPIWGRSADGDKRTGVDPRVKPDTVVYDPELTLSLPAAIAGPSGMNALAHCIEALYGPGANPVTGVVALEGVRALATGLPEVCGPNDGIGPRSDVLYGAHLAGIALASGGTALHHKACHVLGGMFNLDHGRMNAVLLAHALAYNAPAIGSLMPAIGRALGCAADQAPRAVRDLAIAIGAPTGLGEIGMPADGIAAAAARIVTAAANNVRVPDVESIRAMLEDAHVGRPPSLTWLPVDAQT